MQFIIPQTYLPTFRAPLRQDDVKDLFLPKRNENELCYLLDGAMEESTNPWTVSYLCINKCSFEQSRLS